MRFTKIICTLGPTASSAEDIAHLVGSGMSVARINLAHGTRESHAALIHTVKELNASGTLTKLNPAVREIAILVDTKGAEIRTGDRSSPLSISAGMETIFSPRPLPKESRPVILVDYEQFSSDVQRASNIFLDNGKMAFELISVEKDGTVVTRALHDGTVGSRRHINLPGANVDLPALTENDWDDLVFLADAGVDFIGLSFIQRGQDIEGVRQFFVPRERPPRLIAKIETERAVQNASEILHACDGLMVARGDLGAEVPFERLPVIQDELVSLCREAGKPVIVATHMLESMITHPMPTRAEVTDIAHSATISADATMLSGETASGRYPFAAVEAMDRVLIATERHLARHRPAFTPIVRCEREARAEAAVRLAGSAHATALVVITRTGQSARDLSRFRPVHPIIAFTPDSAVERELQLFYGVIPLPLRLEEDPEATVQHAMMEGIRAGFLKRGEKVVLVSDTKAHDRAINTIQIRTIL